MSTTSSDHADALASLLQNLHGWEYAGGAAYQAIEDAGKRFKNANYDRGESDLDWVVSLKHHVPELPEPLLAMAYAARAPSDERMAGTLLCIVQRLDELLAPDLLDTDEGALLKARYRAQGRMNTDPARGWLIPGTPSFVIPPDIDPPPAANPPYAEGDLFGASQVAASLLNCRWLPVTNDTVANCGMPRRDAMQAAADLGKLAPPRIAFTVKSLIRADDISWQDSDRPLTIAVAPLLEVAADVDFSVDTVKNCYHVMPLYPRQRLADVVKRAADARADLLLLPEMSVRSDDLAYLQDQLFNKALGTGFPRFALAGVIQDKGGYCPQGCAPRPTNCAHWRTGPRNSVVVIDASTGDIRLQQDKLTAWDISAATCGDFGLTPPTGGGHMVEDIHSGDTVTLVDLPGLGRVLSLICADLGAAQPGDWLMRHAGITTVHAPIMDRSLCWQWTGVPVHHWAIRRAHRLAWHGALTIVTNSMVLQERNNAAQPCWIAADYDGSASGDDGRLAATGIVIAALPRIDRSVPAIAYQQPLATTNGPIVHMLVLDPYHRYPLPPPMPQARWQFGKARGFESLKAKHGLLTDPHP